MGAESFESTSMHPDVSDAFRDVRDLAGYEHGHGGYTGTVAEKHDYVIVTHTPLPYEAASAMADKLLRNDDPRVCDKWGPAGAIPILRTEGEVSTKVHTVKVVVPGGTDWDGKNKAIEGEVAKLKLVGEVIGTNLISDTPEPAKVKAVATKGRAVTKYVVPGTPRATWQTGLSSQAEARAYAVEWANRDVTHGRQDIETYEVVPVTRREDGEPLVKITRTVAKRTLVAEVSVLKPSALSTLIKATPDGWLFFGYASS